MPASSSHSAAAMKRVLAVGAAEHARKAAPVGLDDVERLPALGNAHAVLVRDVGVPDGAVPVEAYPIGRCAIAEVRPDAPVVERAVHSDCERGQACRVGLGDDSVESSGVMAMPLPKWMLSATSRPTPSDVTQTIGPGAGASPAIMS